MWELLLKRYWLVTTLKEGPENTPYSPFIMGIVSLLFFFLIVVQWHLADLKHVLTISTSILAAITLLISYFSYSYVLLKLNKRETRSLQTVTTLFACHMIIHFFAFPLLFTAPILAQATLSPSAILFIGVVYLLLTIVLTFWQFMVTIHIYKHALEVETLAAALATFGLFACNILIVSFWQ
jgi:fumarate reductase subunit D